MKKQILIAVAVLGTVVACKKEESKLNESPVTETPAQKSKKTLMSQKWKVEGLYVGSSSGPLLPLPQDSCEMDDYIQFTVNNKKVFYTGLTKCYSADPDSVMMNYQINNTGDSLYVTDSEESQAYGMTISNSKIELLGAKDGLRMKMVLGKY